MALVFVLEIDEIFFELFAPRHASRFVTSIARVESQDQKAWFYNLLSLLQLALFFGVVSLFLSQEAAKLSIIKQLLRLFDHSERCFSR